MTEKILAMSGELLHESAHATQRECGEDAVRRGVSLADADLAGANLAGAYLADADLADAYLAGARVASGEVATCLSAGVVGPWAWIAWGMRSGAPVLRIGCAEHAVEWWEADEGAALARKHDADPAHLTALCAFVRALAEAKTG